MTHQTDPNAFHFTGLRTFYGLRDLAGTTTCRCEVAKVLACPFHVHCGHCNAAFHRWDDGNLVGLEMTCTDEILTVRQIDFDVVLHRCNEDDTVLDAVDQVIAQLMPKAVTPA